MARLRYNGLSTTLGAALASAGGSGPSYSSAVLADNPLAYYRFAETSGTTMVDASGNNRSGSYVSGYSLGATGLLLSDPSNTSLDCLGTGKPASVPSASWMNQSPFSVEFLLRLDNVTGNQTVVARYDETSAAAGMMFAVRVDSGTLNFYRSNGGFITLSGPTLVANTTYHIVASYDNTTARIYVNGALVASAAQAGHSYPGAPLTIGATSNGAERVDGRIDEVAYYGTALSGARVQAHYDAATQSSAAPTTITFAAPLTHSNGLAVPTITSGDTIPLSLLKSDGTLAEIVYLSAYTAGATTGTVVRAQEGTAAAAHANGAKVVHAPTVLDFAAGATVWRSKIRDTGDIGFNSSGFADVDAGLDLVVPCQAGDVVELTLVARISTSSYFVGDFHTMVAGSPVNSVTSKTTPSASGFKGLAGWGGAGTDRNLAGSIQYTVQPSDVSSGAVTFRLRAFSGGGVTVRGADPVLYVAAVTGKVGASAGGFDIPGDYTYDVSQLGTSGVKGNPVSGTTMVTDGDSMYNGSNTQNDAFDFSLWMGPGSWTVEALDAVHTNRAIQTWQVELDDGTWLDVGTIDWYANVAPTAAKKTLTFTVPSSQTTRRRRLRCKAATRNASATGWYISFRRVNVVQTSSPATSASAVGASPPLGTMLTAKYHDPSSLATYSTTASAPADVDAANLAVTFTMPPSGQVKVTLSAFHYRDSAAQTRWGLREGTTDVTLREVSEVNGAAANARLEVIVTGTPGATRTLKWSQASTGGTSYMYAGGAGGSFPRQPAIMEVYAA